MGDHRLNVEITLSGTDGKTRKIDWWVNWWPDKPEKLYIEMVRLAQDSGLEVDDKSYLFDSESSA